GHVFKRRMKSDGHGGGEGPRRRRPDDGRDLLAGKCRVEQCGIAGERVLYPNARAGMVRVLDLSFGQCGLVMDAPIDRPQSFVNKSVFKKMKEGRSNHRFVLR